ncbi:hypothetical protein QQS21_004566 [Conoideocrella luteorostrata]|uniref:F-box domain-containing protein n=1 Tax=Conoideocrella luteorostrata TaxID=1105319 RepID=A0AAJ0CS32_9HYPO|nr:hypothetical protein QQS21_004566 [Conoideocrella luteorostrata]
MSLENEKPQSLRHVGRRQIDAYLASLSPWDLLYLRNQCRSGRFWISGLADISDLPVEILFTILRQLDLEDITACRFVSRSWHAIWTQEEVMHELCQYFFPGLVEMCRSNGDTRPARALLQAPLAKYLQHHNAEPFRSSFICWDKFWDTGSTSAVFKSTDLSDDHLDRQEDPARGPQAGGFLFAPPGPLVMYDRSRLAWQVNSTNIIIDDLRSCQRHICSTTGFLIAGDRLSPQGMSYKLLVYAARGESIGYNYSIVRVWHVDLEQWKHFALPGPFARCYVEGERVVVVTRQNLIIAWSWSQACAVDLKLSSRLASQSEGYGQVQSQPGVIIHPNKSNVTYVVWMCRLETRAPDLDRYQPSTNCKFLISVVQYDEGESINWWEKCICPESLCDHPHGLLNNFALVTPLCSKMSPYGLYNIGTIVKAINKPEEPCATEFATVGFNIYKESFIQREFKFAKPSALFAGTYHRLDPIPWGIYAQGGKLTSWSQRHAAIPREVVRDNRAAEKERNGFNADIATAMRIRVRSRSKRWRVLGDEDFQVFVTSEGILVWSYTKETKLSDGHGLSSPAYDSASGSSFAIPARPVAINPPNGEETEMAWL